MDANRFDAIAKTLISTANRRRTLGSLLGGTLALFGLTEAMAKKKKKKCKKSCGPCQQCKKGKCKSKPLGSKCEDDGTCCLAIGQPGKGALSCAPEGTFCCSADAGGGSCRPGEACCASGSVATRGSCAPSNGECCANDNGGFSTPNSPICCPAGSRDFSCSAGFPNCCELGSEADCCSAAFPSCCAVGSRADCCSEAFPNCCPLGSKADCCSDALPNCCPETFPQACCEEGEVCDAILGCVAAAASARRSGNTGSAGASGDRGGSAANGDRER